jgi:acetyl-CoA carboxylase alpha subunit
LGDALQETLKPLLDMAPADLKQQRRQKFLAMGNHGL